ncbi:hypothetical protein P8452_31879 [Trifolium repens]|nr:hypothetical protein P8452_31879 [Trifolium repens]
MSNPAGSTKDPGKEIAKEYDPQDLLAVKSSKGFTESSVVATGGSVRSFKDMMMGGTGDKGSVDGEMASDSSEDEGDDMEDENDILKKDITIEEELIAGYACPKFILSSRVEKRIRKPWRRGLIVKLVGRKVGYKALETRLKQMWVRKGVINIIDLSHDYFLVNFTSKEDQYRALTLGPWMIYDHYLSVSKWSPDFNPTTDRIEKMAVWVRFSGIPIEYYDKNILSIIGNRIGRTIKVDRNTLLQERGKYARLCVEVELAKPLLAMFSIKDRSYKEEYEGLHTLCITCGQFGHYHDGCPKKPQGNDPTGENSNTNSGNNETTTGVSAGGGDGPWTVVQKPKRNRKAKNPAEDEGIIKSSGGNDGRAKNTGSKFNALTVTNDDDETNQGTNMDVTVLEEKTEETNMGGHAKEKTIHETDLAGVIMEERSEENNMERKDMRTTQPRNHAEKSNNIKNRRGKTGPTPKRVDDNPDKAVKDLKLAARGGGNLKGKAGPHMKIDGGKLANLMGVRTRDNLVAQNQKPANDIPPSLEDGPTRKISQLGPNGVMAPGLKKGVKPNIPRPPNVNSTPPTEILHPTLHMEDTLEGEVFVDAHEQGLNGGSDSEMEMVGETQSLPQ